MINLKINNNSCEFSGLSIIRLNPAFNAIGEYTEPFQLDLTEVNKQATGYSCIGQKIPSEKPSANIELFGQPYINGSAVFETAGSKLGGYIAAGKSHFYSLISGKTLNDLKCEGIRFPQLAPPFDSEAQRTANTLKMCLSYPSELCDIIAFPLWTQASWRTLNPWTLTDQEFVVNEDRTCPFIRLTALLRIIFEEHGYIIRDNAIMDDAELKTLCMPNNVPSGSLFYEPDLVTPKKWNKHLPKYSIKSFIADVENVCNVDVHINNATHEVNIIEKGATLRKTPTYNLEQYLTSEISIKRITNQSGRNWSWGKADDDEFAVTTDLTDIIVHGEVATERALPTPSASLVDSVYLVRNTDTYYRYKQTGSDDDPTYEVERFGTRAGALKTGNGTFDRSIGLVPLNMYDYDYSLGTRMMIPRTEQDQLLKWNAAHLDFAPSLLFYRGMVEIDPSETWTAATTYPLGSMFKRDIFGNDIQGTNKELATETLETADTLLNHWMDNPREYLTVNADLMPYSMIRKLNFTEPFTFGNLAFIIDQTKVTANTNSIDGIELCVWRL